jgi:hypothetical protein
MAHWPSVDEAELVAALHGVITAEVADELAEVYSDEPVFPRRIAIDRPDRDGRLFPGWPTPVLLISVENQGVCAWGVPLGVDDPPVIVGGEVAIGDAWTDGTVEYAPNVAHFVAARRWDRACLRGLLIQAQATELDPATLDVLRDQFEEVLPTRGHPGAGQHRLQDGTSKLLLWSGSGQCDWWISSPDAGTLRAMAERLRPFSDLETSMWSDDDAGKAVLGQMRGDR